MTKQDLGVLVPVEMVGSQRKVVAWTKAFARENFAGSPNVTRPPALSMRPVADVESVQWWNNDERRCLGNVFRPSDFMFGIAAHHMVEQGRDYITDESPFWTLDNWYGSEPWFAAVCYLVDPVPIKWRSSVPDPTELRHRIMLRVAQRIVRARGAITVIIGKCRSLSGGAVQPSRLARPLIGYAEMATGTNEHSDYLLASPSIGELLQRFADVTDWDQRQK